MKAQKLISVIIPVHNAEKFLKRSVESVIRQSYEHIELLLINDGSTDKSERICKNYATADKRIRVISQNNCGPSAARNTGIRHTNGEFAFFLDADDFIDKHTLIKLAAAYHQYQPDLVMGNFCKLENDGTILNQRVTFGPDEMPFYGHNVVLFKQNIANYIRHFLKHPSNHLISYCWGRLYKLSIIKNNNIFAHEDMHLFEDFVFNLEYLKYTNKIVFINEPLYTYVMHNDYVSASMSIINSDSLCHDMGVFKKEAIKFFKKINHGTNSLNITSDIGHALTHYVIIFLIRSCRQITKFNRTKIYNEIKKITHAPIFIKSLQHYSPTKNNSRILPLLMKLRLVKFIILYCEYKAYKRYGKLEAT